MRPIERLPQKSASEMFVDAAKDLVNEIIAERGVHIDEDTAARLRTEVIRHYEVATQDTHQRALFSGIYRESREMAPEKIENVNSYMRGWLRGVELDGME
jgi:hypothetical protein